MSNYHVEPVDRPKALAPEAIKALRRAQVKGVSRRQLLRYSIGGAIGLWLASLFVDLDPTSGLLLLYLPPIGFVLGAIIALVTGMLAGLLPAITAMRLNVVSALRRI